MSKKSPDIGAVAAPPEEYPDHMIEGAMSDLMRAEKHKSDPILMKHVHALAGRHQKALKSIKSAPEDEAINSISDIKKVANKKLGV